MNIRIGFKFRFNMKIILALLACLIYVNPARADLFYENKLVTILVGTTPGGGYDTYSRLLASKLGEHIPGHPQIVVRNMPGGGGVVATSFLTSAAPKDGTYINAIFAGSIAEAAFTNRETKHFNARTLHYLGGMNVDTNVCVSNNKQFESVFNKQTIVGATGKGAESYDWTVAFQKTLGLDFRMIVGYVSSRFLIEAVLKNEVEMVCGMPYDIVATAYGSELGNTIHIVAQLDNSEGDPRITDVPLITNYVTNSRKKENLKFVFSQKVFSRTYVVSPEVPSTNVHILREAFRLTLNDRTFLERANKANIKIQYISGQDMQNMVESIYNTDATQLSEIKTLIE